MYCSNCGNKITKKGPFCNNCGQKLVRNNTTNILNDASNNIANNQEIFVANSQTQISDSQSSSLNLNNQGVNQPIQYSNYNQSNIQDNYIVNNQNNANNYKSINDFNNGMINNQNQFNYNQQNVYNSNNQNQINYKNSYNQNNSNQFIGNDQIKPSKKKSKTFSIFALLLVLIIGLGVGGFFLINKEEKINSRTIMLYMVGSDLESRVGLATVDLDSIDYDEIDTENTNVVLIAGGTKKWHNDYIDVKETSIYELTEDGFEKVKTQDIQNMGDADVLSSFLTYTYDNYKTKEYDLIFWNHGSAIMGSEHDEISNDNLSLKEIEVALNASPFHKKNKLETVIFRTCLNGSIEVANIFDEYAEYLVASEEITRGSKYSNVLNFINDIEVTDSAYDFSMKYIDSYKNQMENIKDLYDFGEEYDIYSTYSIVDLSKVEELTNSINEFFEDINVVKNYNEIAKVRSNLYQYASTEPTYDMIDLYNLVDQLKDLSPDKAQTVLDNFENAVVYNWATNSQSRGLSMYFPFNGNKSYKEYLLDLYNDFDELKPYHNFINNFYNLQTTSTLTYSFSENKVSVSGDVENADFKLELTDEQKEGFARSEYTVFRTKGDGEYTPIYKGINAKLDGNTLTANIKNKQLKVINKEVPGEEWIIVLNEKEETDKYVICEVLGVTLQFFDPNDFTHRMDGATITIMIDKETGEVKIIDILVKSDNINAISGLTTYLDDYTQIIFYSFGYRILDENGNYTKDWETKTYYGIETDIDKFEFQYYEFEEEYDYYCVFKIYDVNNNYYYTKLVKLQ